MSRVSFSDGFQYGIEVDDVIQRDRTEFYKRKILKISNVTGAILAISTKEMLQVSFVNLFLLQVSFVNFY